MLDTQESGERSCNGALWCHFAVVVCWEQLALEKGDMLKGIFRRSNITK